jgi:hypothetical protein
MPGTPAMWGLYTACKHKLDITSATPTTVIREGSEDFKPSARRSEYGSRCSNNVNQSKERFSTRGIFLPYSHTHKHTSNP